MLDEASVITKTAALGSNVSLLSKMARSVPPVYAMTVRDSWSMITGFLKDDCVKPTTDPRKNLKGVLVRWAMYANSSLAHPP